MTLDLRTLSDRIAVEEHVLRYAHLLDSGRTEGVGAAIFAEDAELTFGDLVVQGQGAIEAALASSTAILAGCSHNVTNLLIRIDGDTAQASYRVLAWHWFKQPDGSPGAVNDLLMVGGYEDELVRHGEGWRVQRRRAFAQGSGVGIGGVPDALRPMMAGLSTSRMAWA